MRRVAELLDVIVLTLWIGGLWTIGFVVAPTLFRVLDSRALAGAVAGELFRLIAYIGLICGGYLALRLLVAAGIGAFVRLSFWIIVTMLVLIAVGQFGISPILSGLKAQVLPGQVMAGMLHQRFALWHGVSSGLYVVVCVLGAILVALQAGKPR